MSSKIKVEFETLITETEDPRYAKIDRMSVAELAEAMNQADATVPIKVHDVLPEITKAITATSARMSVGGRLIYVGAGTPGRIGVLDASECPPTFNTPPELVFAIMAGGTTALVSPNEGAEDDSIAGAAAIDTAGIQPQDTVIGIAASGRTPFVVAAVRRARELGALTIGLSCNPKTQLSAAAEHQIEVLVGPEILTGSTRLKAGTAQKLVLNMFSTIVMVQQGKTYGSLMVDLNPSNEKLRERALRMVIQITGAAREPALAALTASNFQVKSACIMLKLGASLAEAQTKLQVTNGRLRAALGEL